MPRLSMMGHPVHPILQAIPATARPASTVFDVLARTGGDEEGLSKAAHYSLLFGLAGAAGAAATGILDYYEIDNRPVRRVALYHGLSNVALIACYVASLRRRRDKRARRQGPGPLRARSVSRGALRLPRRRTGLRARCQGGRGRRRHPRGGVASAPRPKRAVRDRLSGGAQSLGTL